MPTDLTRISQELAAEVDRLSFGPPTAYVYNPLCYAWAPHQAYLDRFGRQRGRILLLGMNPGPFGMAQTGIPFGDVTLVRDFLGIEAPVERPAREHPGRPVLGFACPRREVSGTRLWGWARDRFGTAADFFERFFVVNYCPLTFLESGGKNRTPDKLPRGEREALLRICDQALGRMVATLAPSRVIGVGGFAQASARRALSGGSVPIGTILHPSPANPRANRDWRGIVEAELSQQGVALPDQPGARP